VSLLMAGVLLATAGSLQAATAGPEWQVLSNKDGVLLERRPHDGSQVYEVRVTAQSRLAPAAIFDTIWKQREHMEFVPYLKRADLISDAGDERVAYEQVAVPLVKDRDYTVRLQRRVNPDAQRYEVVFKTANEAGPPPDKSHVRINNIQGRWLVEPGADGKGAKVSYEVLSEPGGAIPTWLVNRVQGEAVTRLVRAMLQRTLDKQK
jgi:ribosome-associated toxin RatA of RatAB toxin-antitoxin module